MRNLTQFEVDSEMYHIFIKITKSSFCFQNIKSRSVLIARNSSGDFSSRSRTVIGSFPLVRLLFQVVYRIARPFANELVLRAQKNIMFREYLCIPLGRTIHWMDIKVRVRMLNLGRLNLVPKIDDKKAMDLGAQLLLEIIVLIIFSLIVIYQYNESVEKEEKKETKRKNDIEELTKDINQIECAINKNKTHMTELNMLLDSMRPLVS